MAGIIHRLGVFLAVVVAALTALALAFTEVATQIAVAMFVVAFATWLFFRGLAWVVDPVKYGLRGKGKHNG